jgi:hypothetical protein
VVVIAEGIEVKEDNPGDVMIAEDSYLIIGTEGGEVVFGFFVESN